MTTPETESDFDKYGNPIDGSRLINCCFPDCGCDGSQHYCDAEQGASCGALNLNIEQGSLKVLRMKKEQL